MAASLDHSDSNYQGAHNLGYTKSTNIKMLSGSLIRHRCYCKRNSTKILYQSQSRGFDKQYTGGSQYKLSTSICVYIISYSKFSN